MNRDGMFLSNACSWSDGEDSATRTKLCSADRPLLLVVEDINKSGQAPFLAEKLSKWSSLGKATNFSDAALGGQPDRERWRLLCPIWPRITASLEDDTRKRVERRAAMGAAFTGLE